MEGLNPTLKVILYVKRGLKNGESLEKSLKSYFREPADEFSVVIYQWIILKKQGLKTSELIFEQKSIYRQQVLQLFEQAWQGIPIFETLLNLEEEVLQAINEEIDQHILELPFKSLIPLLLFQFPAYGLLLIGPILNEFIQGLSL